MQNIFMIKFFKNLLLYISAFVPMYVLVFVKLIVEIINDNLHFNVLNTVNLVTLLLLIGGGVFGLWWNVCKDEGQAIEIEMIAKENTTDKHFLGYFSLFVFFAIPLDLSLVSAYCVYVLVLVMIGVVYINNSLYYINPFLNLLGYNFYDVRYRVVGEDEVKKTKMFFRGELKLDDGRCTVKVKNEHFYFVDKKR